MKTADYSKTCTLAGIVLFLTLQKGSGFVLILLLPFFLLGAIYQCIRIVRKPDERKKCSIRLAIWLATLVLAGALQAYWDQSSRNNAEQAAQKVFSHKQRTGAYPASLQEASLNETRLRDKWRIRYTVRHGRPYLSYPMTFLPLSTYEYDFEACAWRKNVY